MLVNKNRFLHALRLVEMTKITQNYRHIDRSEARTQWRYLFERRTDSSVPINARNDFFVISTE
ncbi:MAG: hypothetical protein KAH25_00255 [Bacteroidales bacterium]|nr:hypothetical protein [Bacteroidales bacterium]